MIRSTIKATNPRQQDDDDNDRNDGRRRETHSGSRSLTWSKVYLAFAVGYLMHSMIDKITNLDSELSSTPQIRTASKNKSITNYVPSSCENYIMEHESELGYDTFTNAINPSGCTIWKNVTATNTKIYNQLQSYSINLDKYNTAVRNFEPIPDLMIGIRDENYDVCSSTKLHERGLNGMFPSRQLSLTKSGYVEPLTPPMRSHKFCFNASIPNLMSLDYLVHDYEAMCRNLKPTSKRVLFDLGATLNLGKANGLPIMMQLMEEYEKFGFVFDHIYAFEVTKKDAQQIYEKLLPAKYFASYHWINVGVNAEEGNRMNPINSILDKFDEDDFIVFKLDIDTASIEVPLAYQLLEGGKDGIYHRLIDQFYFEHHVHVAELRPFWGLQKNGRVHWNGTIKDTLDLFHGMRSKGIPAHFWP